MSATPPSSLDPILGCLLGTGVGDALGLPAEGMSRERIAKRWKDLRHRFFLNSGMFSDDTEHTLMVASALITHRHDVGAFQRSLGWKFRWWLLGLPAGVGLSTAKAIIRLWLGWPVSRSGVFSAGNGAAMRSAIIGVVFRDDVSKRRSYVEACSRITHTDPRAVEAALLVAEAASLAAVREPTKVVIDVLAGLITSEEMRSHFSLMVPALEQQIRVEEFVGQMGCAHGVSGFAPHTAAVALYAWLRHRNAFADAVTSAIACGGDADTVAAITGAVAGAESGVAGIPEDWLNGIKEWPRSLGYIRRLAQALHDERTSAPPLFWPALPLRNLFFLGVVLLHGFRRLLPPY